MATRPKKKKAGPAAASGKTVKVRILAPCTHCGKTPVQIGGAFELHNCARRPA